MSYNNKVIVSVTYHFPSQNNDEFNLFSLLSNISKGKPSLSVVTDDFNVRSSFWYSNDINTTEGLKLFSLTSLISFSQIINEPTHFQTDSSSCIDLVFTDQSNLSVKSGFHASFHPNCHHQIVHPSFNLDIYYPHHTSD